MTENHHRPDLSHGLRRCVPDLLGKRYFPPTMKETQVPILQQRARCALPGLPHVGAR